MADFPRRAFLKVVASLGFWASLPAMLPQWAKASKIENSDEPLPDEPIIDRQLFQLNTTTSFPPGYLSIVQGPTSDSETLINVLAPRLRNYIYEATDSSGQAVALQKYDTVVGPHFYKVDKIKVSGLRVGEVYTLKVKTSSTVVDERTFKTLNVRQPETRFALLSCMCDDYRFDQVINPMWQKLQSQNPDFLILNGDAVYVDSFEFVERGRATELDIWQRYVDAMKRIPLYHWQNLVPVLATWDDHDYGTNDGDRDFPARLAAERIFRAIFGGTAIAGAWTPGPGGVSSEFTAFGQRFYLMDDRSFRQPNRNQVSPEPYGHWGEAQHRWLMQRLGQNSNPSWLINGNQFFEGVNLSYKESFEGNHAQQFRTLTQQLSNLTAPVLFASGDIHLSEIMAIPSQRLGYETYELTSSSMHSYTGTGWANPLRLADAYCIDHNFLMIHAQANTQSLDLEISCYGLPNQAYFTKTLRVSKSP